MVVDIPKRKEVTHDEAPAIITSHPFVPRSEWWTLCKVCGLAQSAHSETTIDSEKEMRKSHKTFEIEISYYGDDNPEEFE